MPAERIAQPILVVRGHRVMLDADLANLYAVPTKALLQAVRRNAERFPDDFMFRREAAEWEALRSQFVTSNAGRGGRRYAPHVFTEQGVAMLSSVLRSPRAIAVNVEIMRAFVRLREGHRAPEEGQRRNDQRYPARTSAKRSTSPVSHERLQATSDLRRHHTPDSELPQ